MTNELHMYEVLDADYVIALSTEDAETIWRETTGDKEVELDEADLLELDDHFMMKCWVNTSGRPCEHGDGEPMEHTAREWCELLGRGFAFSEDER
mgnify:CR=1 FL=1